MCQIAWIVHFIRLSASVCTVVYLLSMRVRFSYTDYIAFDEDYFRLIVRILEGFFRCNLCFIWLELHTHACTHSPYCSISLTLAHTSSTTPSRPPFDHRVPTAQFVDVCVCACSCTAVVIIFYIVRLWSQTTCCISVCNCPHAMHIWAWQQQFAKYIISAVVSSFCHWMCRTAKWSDKPIQFALTHYWTTILVACNESRIRLCLVTLCACVCVFVHLWADYFVIQCKLFEQARDPRTNHI